MAYVSRDPFARTEIHRRAFAPMNLGYYGLKQPTCDWCGGLNRRGALYVYSVESDGGRRSDIRGAFCSIGCMRAYHRS